VTDPAFEVVVFIVVVIIVCIVQAFIVFEATVAFVDELRHVQGVSFVVICVEG